MHLFSVRKVPKNEDLTSVEDEIIKRRDENFNFTTPGYIQTVLRAHLKDGL